MQSNLTKEEKSLAYLTQERKKPGTLTVRDNPMRSYPVESEYVRWVSDIRSLLPPLPLLLPSPDALTPLEKLSYSQLALGLFGS